MNTKDFEGHTPGPWLIGYGGCEGDDYAVITSPHSSRAICNLEPQDYLKANAELISNARLIAAAPELLREREQLLDMLKEIRTVAEDVLRSIEIGKRDGRHPKDILMIDSDWLHRATQKVIAKCEKEKK